MVSARSQCAKVKNSEPPRTVVFDPRSDPQTYPSDAWKQPHIQAPAWYKLAEKGWRAWKGSGVFADHEHVAPIPDVSRVLYDRQWEPATRRDYDGYLPTLRVSSGKRSSRFAQRLDVSVYYGRQGRVARRDAGSVPIEHNVKARDVYHRAEAGNVFVEEFT
jgi:hypothetical protein